MSERIPSREEAALPESMSHVDLFSGIRPAGSASPPKPTDCEPFCLSSETKPGNATSPITGPECPSSGMSTTLKPSSVQLWPTATSSDCKRQKQNMGGNESLPSAAQVHLWPTPRSNAISSTRTDAGNPAKDGKMLDGEAKAHSFARQGFPVSQPLPLVSEKEVAMTVGFGLRLSEWLSDSNPAGLFVKTLLASPRFRSPLRSLAWTLKGYAGCPDEPSLKSSRDLTLPGMTCHGIGMESLGFRLCRLSVSELSTSEIGSGSSQDVEMWATPREAEWKGCGPTGSKSHQHRMDRDYLDAQAQSHAELWSTPRALDGEKGGPNMSFGAGGTPLPAQAAGFQLWRTPETFAGGRSAPSTAGRDSPGLEYDALQWSFQTGPKPSSKPGPTESRGQLNPDWVCWLQGFPAGWLNYAGSGTPSSRQSRKKSSGQ